MQFRDPEGQSESDNDEPYPEAVARYNSMRRHTVGPGNPPNEDPRLKLGPHPCPQAFQVIIFF